MNELILSIKTEYERGNAVFVDISKDMQSVTEASAKLNKEIKGLPKALEKLSTLDYSFVDQLQKLADLKINVDLQAFNDFAKSINVIKKALSSNDIDFSKFTDAFIGMVERLNNIELSVNFVNFSKTISETTTIINQFDKLSNEVKTTGDSFDNLKNKSQHTFGTVGALFSNIFQDFKNLKNESKNTDGSGSNSFLGKFQGIISVIGQSFGILSKNLKTAKSNFNGLGATTKNVNNSLKETKSLAGILAKQFLDLGKNIARSIRNFIGQKLSFQNISEYASSLVEVQNVIDKTFGESAAVIENFTKTSSDLFGINTLQTKQYAGRFQAMGVAIGLAKDQMAGVSETMTKLSADYASFYNTTFESAAKDMMAIFDGQSRKMKKYGIDITDTALQEYALANGITKSTKAMTQREKAQLRFNLIMERSKDIMGDFNLTHTSWANQIKLINNNMQELGGYLGTMLTQTLRPILIVVNQIISRVNILLSSLVGFLANKFNWELDFKGGLIEDEADSAEDLADNLDEAGKAAKNASTGIDELNILTQPTAKTEDNNMGEVLDGWNSEYAKVEKQTSELEEMVNSFFDKVLEKLKPLISQLREVYDNLLKPLGSLAFDNLKSVYNDVIKPIANLVIGEGLPVLFKFLSDLGSKINWKRLTDGMTKLWQVLGKFVSGIGRGFIGFFRDITPLLTDALAFIINGISIAFNGLAHALNLVPTGVLEFIGRALAAFLTFKTVLGFIGNIARVVTNLATAFQTLGMILGAAALPVAIIAVTAALAGLAAGLINWKIDEHLKAFGTSFDKIDAAIKKVNDLKTARDNYLNGGEQFQIEAGYIDELAEKYFELAETENRTAEQDALLKFYADELVEVCPELRGQIDEVSGAYKGTRDSIEQVIQKTKELAEVEALKGYYTESIKAQVELQAEYEKTQIALEDLKTKTAERMNSMNWFDKFQLGGALVDNLGIMKLEGELKKQEAALEEANNNISFWESKYTEKLGNTQETIANIGNTAIEDGNKKIVDNTNNSINTMTGNTDKVVSSAQDNAEKASQAIKEGADKVSTAVGEMNTQVETMSTIPEKLESITGSLDNLKDKTKESGYNTVEGFNEGITERIDAASTTMDELGQYVINSFDEKLGIHSPSTVFNDIAGYVIAGYVNGIKEHQKMALDTMKYLADNIQIIFKGDENFGVNYQVWSEYAHQINLGFADGINIWGHIAIEAVQAWAAEIMASFEEEMDINSPSKVFESYGGFITKGLANGIDNTASDSINSMHNLGADMQKEFEKFANFNIALNQSVQGLKDFEISEKINVSLDMNDFYKQIEEAQRLSFNASLENYNNTQKPIEVNIPKISVEIDSREIARANYKGQKQLGYQIKR